MAHGVLDFIGVVAIQLLQHRAVHCRNRAAFTILEIMVAAGVLAVAVSGVFALNSQVVNNLRRSTVSSYASQLIQERMEQFRRASWTELTSNYPPDDDDPADDGYDVDTEDDPYVEDTYPTEFPYDMDDVDALTPGLEALMATSTASAAQLGNVVETVRVETYNPSSTAALTVFTGNADGSTVDIGPRQVGGNPIVVERRNGAVTTVSHNPVLVLSTTVRLTLTVSWTGTDKVTRTKQTVTLFTVEGDK